MKSIDEKNYVSTGRDAARYKSGEKLVTVGAGPCAVVGIFNDSKKCIYLGHLPQPSLELQDFIGKAILESDNKGQDLIIWVSGLTFQRVDPLLFDQIKSERKFVETALADFPEINVCIAWPPIDYSSAMQIETSGTCVIQHLPT